MMTQLLLAGVELATNPIKGSRTERRVVFGELIHVSSNTRAQFELKVRQVNWI